VKIAIFCPPYFLNIDGPVQECSSHLNGEALLKKVQSEFVLYLKALAVKYFDLIEHQLLFWGRCHSLGFERCCGYKGQVSVMITITLYGIKRHVTHVLNGLHQKGDILRMAAVVQVQVSPFNHR
jgi:hypothetical protein